MSPGLKYTLARFGIFVACTVPAVLLLPRGLDLLPRILIGAVLSAIVSFAVLRRWRDEMAEQIATGMQTRRAEKERLRSALSGDDEPAAEPARDASADS